MTYEINVIGTTQNNETLNEQITYKADVWLNSLLCHFNSIYPYI
jgi:hypothetical protein